MTPSAPRRPRSPRGARRQERREGRQAQRCLRGKADAKSVAAGAAAEAVKADFRRFRSTRCRDNDRQRPQRQARARALRGGGTSGLLANALAKAAMSAALTSRPLPRPMATTWTCSPTLTWSTWPRRPQATADLRGTERVGASASPAVANSTSSSPRTATSLAFVSEQLSVVDRASRPSKTGWPLRFRLDDHVMSVNPASVTNPPAQFPRGLCLWRRHRCLR